MRQRRSKPSRFDPRRQNVAIEKRQPGPREGRFQPACGTAESVRAARLPRLRRPAAARRVTAPVEARGARRAAQPITAPTGTAWPRLPTERIATDREALRWRE